MIFFGKPLRTFPDHALEQAAEVTMLKRKEGEAA